MTYDVVVRLLMMGKLDEVDLGDSSRTSAGASSRSV